MEMLKVNDMVTRFKQRLAEDPLYLQKKVKQYLKVNSNILQKTSLSEALHNGNHV